MKSSLLFLCVAYISEACGMFLRQAPFNQQAFNQPAYNQPAYQPFAPHQPMYDIDMPMSCMFGATPKVSAASGPAPPLGRMNVGQSTSVGGPSHLGPGGIGRHFIDPDIVADRMDTIQDLHPADRHMLHQRHRARMNAAAATTAPPLPRTQAPTKAPTAAQAVPNTEAPIRNQYNDFFGLYGGFYEPMYHNFGGVVKRQTVNTASHPGLSPSTTCMCIPSNDIDGSIINAYRTGQPNPWAEESINSRGKCPAGRVCVCPNLARRGR